MLEITLLKTLFHEIDPDKIPEARVYDNNEAYLHIYIYIFNIFKYIYIKIF